MIIKQNLTKKEIEIIEKAIEKLTPVYEKAMGRAIRQDEIDLAWAHIQGALCLIVAVNKR